MPRKPPTGIDRSRVTVAGPDGVTKHYGSSERAHLAAEKYRRLAAVGADRFTSPVPREVGDDPPRVVFDLLEAGPPAGDVIAAALRSGDPTSARAAVAAIGRALARIHDHLVLDTRRERPRAPALRRHLAPRQLSAHPRTPLVFLHGDFGFSNVCFDPRGVPVVFDPEPSRYTSHAIDAFDYPEMDLATFVLCLGGRARRFRDAIALHRAAPELVGAFLDAYRDGREDADGAYDPARLADLVIAQALAYRDVAGWRAGAPVGRISRRTAGLVR